MDGRATLKRVRKHSEKLSAFQWTFLTLNLPSNAVNVVEAVKSDGSVTKYVKDCAWMDRIVEEGGRNTPGDRDTLFFLHIGDNPATGKPRYADKVVVLDESGKPVIKSTDSTGKPTFVMRYVGPQDAIQGSTLRVVWELPKIYITETTGPTPVAKDVYITHPKKKASTKARGTLDDVEVEDLVDQEEILAVQKESLEQIAASAQESSLPNEDNASETGSKKRKSEKGEKSSKKSRATIVEEDF